jgi:hemin uptake protein HemP
MNLKSNADDPNAASSPSPGNASPANASPANASPANASATSSVDGAGAESIASTRSLTWEALSQGERHLLIRYNGQEYDLRETRNGKLILTK